LIFKKIGIAENVHNKQESLKMPEWIIWIDNNDSLTFYSWNTIKAWCKTSWWNVIEVVLNEVNEIIEIQCCANVDWKLRCSNHNAKNNVCIIKSKIKKLLNK
jgi:hypothetical protein